MTSAMCGLCSEIKTSDNGSYSKMEVCILFIYVYPISIFCFYSMNLLSLGTNN